MTLLQVYFWLYLGLSACVWLGKVQYETESGEDVGYPGWRGVLVSLLWPTIVLLVFLEKYDDDND
jgi:hypothetical protein